MSRETYIMLVLYMKSHIMDIKDILEKCDHTLLRVDCTSEEIRKLCDQAIKYNCASVCIPPLPRRGRKALCR